MTGRPDAGPGAGEPETRTPTGAPTGATDTTRRVCIDTDATPEQLTRSARRLRDLAEGARDAAAGQRARDAVTWNTAEHERAAEAYEKAAGALDGLAGPDHHHGRER